MLDFIWRPVRGRNVVSKIDMEAETVETPKVAQSMALRLTVDLEYPTNVDMVDILTKAKFRIELPEGFSCDNARLTNVELL